MEVRDIRSKGANGRAYPSRCPPRPNRLGGQPGGCEGGTTIRDRVVVENDPPDGVAVFFKEASLGLEDGVFTTLLLIAVVDEENSQGHTFLASTT